MPWNVLIFPLLGGFVCLDWCFVTRLRNQRIDGNRLLLEAALAGVWLAMVTHLVVSLCERRPAGAMIADWWYRIAPCDVPYLGTGILAFWLGVALAFLLNILLDKDFAKRKAIEKVGDYVLSAFYEAASRFELVQVVLDTNKVYVALVATAPNLKPENHVVLLPVLEGFRDKETLVVQYLEKRIAWTYAWPVEEKRWAETIIPLNTIKSVNRVQNLRDLRAKNPYAA